MFEHYLVECSLQIGDHQVPFADALQVAPDQLLGEYQHAWPLTKVLDIGGAAVKPSFAEEREQPPIPCALFSSSFSP
jgi:hypothetical protein